MGDEKITRELITAIVALTKALENQPRSGHPASDIIIAVIPLAGVVFGSVLLFFFFLWQYKLKRELIRTNQYEHGAWKNLRVLSLLIGSISALIGLPMTILFLVINGASYAALGGIVPLFAGLGLLLFYALSRRMTAGAG